MQKKQLIPKKISVKISKEKIREYKEIFDILDKNNIGIISTRDIIKLRKIFYFPISEMVINNIIKDIDIFGDGNFDFKNFVTFMKKQMEYINENDEQIIFESIKDEYKNEYLGNKRKREKVYKNKSIKDKEYKYPINFSNESSVDELINSREENIENDLSFTSDALKKNKKKKLNNTFSSINYFVDNRKNKCKNQYNNIQINKNSIFKNVNVDMIVEKNVQNNNFNNKLLNKYYKFKNKDNKNIIINDNNKNSKYKKKNPKKINKSKNDIILDSIEINKKALPMELVNQIEEKQNYPLILPNIKYNNNINNNMSISSDVALKSNNLFDTNLGEELSFTSDFNLNSGFINNSRNEKSPTINNSQKRKNYIADFPYRKSTEEKKEKMFNFTSIDNNLDMNTNFPNNEKANQMDIKPDNSIDNKIFFTYNDNNYINDTIDLTDEIIIKDTRNNDNKRNYNNINRNTKDKKNKDKTNNNIQILNTFEFEYKKNKKKDKIIRKSKEIPYSIIVDKSAINISEIQNYLSYEFENNQKSVSFPLKNQKEMNNKYYRKNPFFLKDFEFEINDMKNYKSNEPKKGRKNEKECKKYENKKGKIQKGRKKKTPKRKNDEKSKKDRRVNNTTDHKNKKNKKLSYSIVLEPIEIKKKYNK